MKNNRLSFVIIGKNEGWKLTNCLEHMLQGPSLTNLSEFEVVYVDSKSTDDSIKRALAFNNIKVIQLTNYCNAALARNAGAKVSFGDILCFLDGDMELMPEFIPEIFHLVKENRRFISGQIIEVFYDSSWNKLAARPMFPENRLDRFDVTNGGAFVIDRLLWDSVNGMRTKFDFSEDVDLNYRMTRLGRRIYRSSTPYVKHHTIQYDYKSNLLLEINRFRKYLFRGVLLREHLFNRSILKRNFRINYSIFLMIACIVPAVFLGSLWLLLPYFLIVLFRAYRQFTRFRKASRMNYFNLFVKYLYIDVTAIIGMLFFFPGNRELSYEIIQPASHD